MDKSGTIGPVMDKSGTLVTKSGRFVLRDVILSEWRAGRLSLEIEVARVPSDPGLQALEVAEEVLLPAGIHAVWVYNFSQSHLSRPFQTRTVRLFSKNKKPLLLMAR